MNKCIHDTAEIAKQLGIYSHSGKPHIRAIDAIMKQLHIDGADNVIAKIDDWLSKVGYPERLVCGSKVIRIRYKACGSNYIKMNAIYR